MQPGDMVGKTATASAGMTIGRHELVCKLSESEYGTLWAARPLAESDDSGTVALRYIDTSLAGGTDTTSEIASVARAATVVEHDNLVPIIEAVEEGTTLGVVSSFVEGETLGSLLRVASVRRSPIPKAVALRIVADLLEALAEVESKSKALGKHDHCASGGVGPGTVLVGADGRSRLLEFGLAGFAARIEAWVGDPKRVAYCAPEALGDEPAIGAGADVFSLGVFLWEMLQNKRLFGGLSYAAVAKKVKEQTIGRADASRSPDAETVGKPLADLVARALERDQDERFAGAAEMLAALRALDDKPASREDVGATVEKLAGRVIASHRTAIEKVGTGPARRPALSKPAPAQTPDKPAPSPGAKKPPPPKKKAPPVPPDKKGAKPSPPKLRKPPAPPAKAKPQVPETEPPTEEIDLEEALLGDEPPASEQRDLDEAGEPDAADGPPSVDEPEPPTESVDTAKATDDDEPDVDEDEEDEEDEDNRLTLPVDDLTAPAEEDGGSEPEKDEDEQDEPEPPVAAPKPAAAKAAVPASGELAVDLDEPEPGRSKLGLLLGAAAVVIIIIVVVSMMGDAEETATEPPTTTTTAAPAVRTAEPEPSTSEPDEAPEDAGREDADAGSATPPRPTAPAAKPGPGKLPSTPVRPPPPRPTKPPATKPPERYVPGDL